jgi:hypothetical protein
MLRTFTIVERWMRTNSLGLSFCSTLANVGAGPTDQGDARGVGIGQLVTLRFPSEKLRDINQLIEKEAWGGYRTEFYPTYDYRAIYQIEQSKNQ